MSVQLHPDIGNIDKKSLCYSIYSRLYLNFFNAQQRKDEEHPYGIEEGDETSIRLKNTAYGFASAIAGTAGGEGGGEEGGLLLDYLKKSGGDMSGILRANYGFEAGAGNTRIIETYADETEDSESVVTQREYGIRLSGKLKIGGDALYIGGKNLLRYDAETGMASLDAFRFSITADTVTASGEWTFGNKTTGVFITPTLLQVAGNDVYHKGNANQPDADWQMRDGTVHGMLAVKGNAEISGRLSALQGVSLGDKGKILLSFGEEDVLLSGNLAFSEGNGIRIGGKRVLVRQSEERIQLGSLGGDLLLGSDDTPKIRLFSGLSDIDGDCLILSPYGKACFPGGLSLRHDYGEALLSTYRQDADDEGIIIHKHLRFHSFEGLLLAGDSTSLSLSSSVEYVEDGITTRTPHTTRFSHTASTSRYAPTDRKSESFRIDTDAGFITAGVPLEAAGHVGIDGSATRLCDGILYFTEELRLQAVTDGIKHYGNDYFTGAVSSESFSSGLSGSGWAIRTSPVTGLVTATFDEVVARHKLRAYEFEVVKLSATNGALWVSDHCSGDSVEKL